MSYDHTDRKLIAAMRQDSCMHLADFVACTGIPKSTAHERITKLVRNGLHCVPLIDFAAVGCALQAVFIVPFNAAILTEPYINAAFQLSPSNLLLVCVFASVRELEAFKERARAKTYYTVVDVLKQEGFVPVIDETQTPPL